MGERIQNQEFYIEADVDSNDSTITYIGKANVNSDGNTSRAIWQIARFIEVGEKVSGKYANGDVKFDNIWDDRESLEYK